MKEQIKITEKIQLSNKETANLSDAEFKTLVIRMLTEMVEYCCKMEEVKAMQSEIKKNAHGTNSDRKETKSQINDLDQKEEINIQPEENEETRIQKNEKRFRNFWDNFKCSKIRIIGVPEGGEEEQEIENIMQENFPDLAEETDFHEAQEAQGVPKKLDPRRNTPRHTIITLAKIKDKERILKAAREKKTVTYQGVPIKLSAD